MAQSMRTALLTACMAIAAGSCQAGQNTLYGVYYGFRTDQLNNKVRADHYTFLPDGRAFRGYPAEGFARSIEWEWECRFAECGTYVVRGEEVRFTNQVAGTETVFTRDREGVLRKPSSSQGYRAMHIPDNVRFAATYGVFDPQEAKPIAALTLQGDGRFVETGMLRYLSWSELGRDASSRARSIVDGGGGAYSIRQGTLELRYDAGLTARLLIVIPPGLAPTGTPRTIHLNGTPLERR